jgi:hypothetical protein
MLIKGLIQTFLHDIGEQLPGMLPTLFPDRWAQMELTLNLKAMALQSWTYLECLRAF